MQSKSLKSLTLNKKVISDLSQLNNFMGGGEIQKDTEGTAKSDTCTCCDWSCSC